MLKDKFCISKKKLFFITIVFIIATIFKLSTYVNKNKNVQDTKAVVGGDIVKNKQPFMVAISLDKEFNPVNREEYVECTGTLINKDWVLTAGHCLLGDMINLDKSKDPNAYYHKNYLPGKSFHMYIGNNDVRTDRLINRVEAEEYFFYDRDVVNQYYRKGQPLPNDIALIKINKSSNYLGANSFPSVPRKTDASLYSTGKTVTAMGYGCIEMNKPSNGPLHYEFNKKLNEVSGMPILESKDSTYTYSKTLFTVGWPVGDDRNLTKNICSGDSGGPVLTDNKKYIVGVSANSWYLDKNPFFATRTIDFADWIAATVSANKACYHKNKIVYSQKYNSGIGYFRDSNYCVHNAGDDEMTGYKCDGNRNAVLETNAASPCFQKKLLDVCQSKNWKGYKCSNILEYGKTMTDQGVKYSCVCTVKNSYPTLERVN